MNAPIASPAHAQQASTGSTAQTSPTVLGVPQASHPGPKPQSTDAYLKDFTLLAEAAKRAQMAVMMRDFESVGL
ncbi:hypothetical protein MAPG_05445 [Magnaporthiopsis poae ATCC 64411]|uniref:Thiol methyltransferase n=1 Tax=Magnaporthiopsis poae (strain ATCC 64411 / 73-15) TaxID=644358 RepID=A0A0C4DZE6_MAGP6|nr:hypothetical protein MAPG_05445 [Magnaporthiopsis poae ATCC 64411]